MYSKTDDFTNKNANATSCTSVFSMNTHPKGYTGKKSKNTILAFSTLQ